MRGAWGEGKREREASSSRRRADIYPQGSSSLCLSRVPLQFSNIRALLPASRTEHEKTSSIWCKNIIVKKERRKKSRRQRDKTSCNWGDTHSSFSFLYTGALTDTCSSSDSYLSLTNLASFILFIKRQWKDSYTTCNYNSTVINVRFLEFNKLFSSSKRIVTII